MEKGNFEEINPENKDLKTETDHVNVDLSVQEFDESYSELNALEDVDDKVIKHLERQIRGSYEYKQYIKYLKDELDISNCALTPGLDLHDIKFQLEFHHYPLSLYDIVSVITNNKLTTKAEDQSVSMFDIMETVMREHYDGNVGLVPLSSTAHEMYHNGAVMIPASSVYGNYDRFIAKYKPNITPELEEKVLTAKSITEEQAKTFNEKLNKNTLNYNIHYNKKDD